MKKPKTETFTKDKNGFWWKKINETYIRIKKECILDLSKPKDILDKPIK